MRDSLKASCSREVVSWIVKSGNLAFCLLCLLGASACNTSINWQNHATFRSYGEAMELSHIDPDEPTQGAIRANLDYVSIALDTVFFRNLPGLFGSKVAFGLELGGVLPSGKLLKTVPALNATRGAHAFMSFDNAVVIKPFLYTGRNISINLHFKSVPRDEVANISGRMAGAGDMLKKIHPQAKAAVQTGTEIFNSVMAAFSSKPQTWKYSFTLYPAYSVHRDKPEMLFTAARHILLCLPPPDAPGVLRKLKPNYLIRMLKMRGNRLVWKKSGEEYTLTPYIVLNITRYRRYPQQGSELAKLLKKADYLIAHKNYQAAHMALASLGAAINHDEVLTEN